MTELSPLTGMVPAVPQNWICC